jgi:hypothetical protein
VCVCVCVCVCVFVCARVCPMNVPITIVINRRLYTVKESGKCREGAGLRGRERRWGRVTGRDVESVHHEP